MQCDEWNNERREAPGRGCLQCIFPDQGNWWGNRESTFQAKKRTWTMVQRSRVRCVQVERKVQDGDQSKLRLDTWAGARPGRENLSLIPDQSLFLCLNKILTFSHQSTHHSFNRITRSTLDHIDPNCTEEKVPCFTRPQVSLNQLIYKGCNSTVSLPTSWSQPWTSRQKWQLPSGSMCLQVSVIQCWSQSRWHALVITVRRQFGDKIQYCHFQYVLKVIYQSS